MLSVIFITLGFLWMLLPHAVHKKIIQATEKEQSEHLIHLFQGAFVTLLGVFGLVYVSGRSEREKAAMQRKRGCLMHAGACRKLIVFR